MYSLVGKTALVTGAGQGIGKGIALALAASAANIIVADKNRETAQAVASEINNQGIDALALQLDVTDLNSIETAVNKALTHYKQLDILVNNAAVLPKGDGMNASNREFSLCCEVNLMGVWNMVQQLLPSLKSQGRGAIINIAAGSGVSGSPACPAYSAAKAGTINLTKSLAGGLGAYNITVNSINPGLVQTPMTEPYYLSDVDGPNQYQEIAESRVPLKCLIQPEDIGHAVVFLASDQARFITGQTLNVDGGLSVG